MAPIMALESLKQPHRVKIFSDAQYVVKGYTEWLPGWLPDRTGDGWISSSGKPVKNRDLWERLHEACQPHQVSWQWVKGHAGNPRNERADRRANEAAETARRRV